MFLQNERKSLGDWFVSELNNPARSRPTQERIMIMQNLKNILEAVVRFAISNIDQANNQTRARMVDEFHHGGD